MNQSERTFLQRQTVAVLATAGQDNIPHAVPVCFSLQGNTVYITIDEKPKKVAGGQLRRIKNIAANENVALLVHHYDHRDWSQLGWVMVQGRADILWTGDEHGRAQDQLRSRYAQLRDMKIATQPVIAIRTSKTLSWGQLSASADDEHKGL